MKNNQFLFLCAVICFATNDAGWGFLFFILTMLSGE